MQTWKQAKLRPIGSTIPVVDIRDLMTHFGIEEMSLTTDKATGQERLQLFTAGRKGRLSLKVGKTVKLENNDSVGRIRELVTGHVIYTGSTKVPDRETGEIVDQQWFTFGVESALEETQVVSVADIFAKGGVVVA